MDSSLAKNLRDLRQAGVPDRYMPRLVRAVRDLDRAAAQMATLPKWKVFIVVNGQSSSTIIHATTADQAKRDAAQRGYNVTGLVVAVK